MGFYSNWPDDQIPAPARSPEQMRSREAGAELARALEAMMRAMQGYELDVAAEVSGNISTAVHHLDTARGLFGELREGASSEPMPVPLHVKSALFAVQSLSQTLGGPLIDGVPRFWDQPEARVSMRELMEFTTGLTSRWANALREFRPDVAQSSVGRRIAADAANLQLFGILVSEILADQARLRH